MKTEELNFAAVDLVTSAGGNVGSMSRCLTRLGVKFQTKGNFDPPSGECPVILPGVGAFGTVMASLNENKFSERLKAMLKGGTPFLGVCVGMQLLFDESEEAPGVSGLGLVSGKVVRYRATRVHKVPQIGWNKIVACREMTGDIKEGFVYFVNSYYACPREPGAISYLADYGGAFCAALQVGNFTAFQFHPEKSGDMGERLLKEWLSNVSK